MGKRYEVQSVRFFADVYGNDRGGSGNPLAEIGIRR